VIFCFSYGVKEQDSTLANNHTPNEENKGEATSQRGPPTDKELPQQTGVISSAGGTVAAD
jgi:hypothetical protein